MHELKATGLIRCTKEEKIVFHIFLAKLLFFFEVYLDR